LNLRKSPLVRMAMPRASCAISSSYIDMAKVRLLLDDH
jgi:hypothetical protein